MHFNAMQSRNVIRAFLFVVFFGIGVAAVGGPILYDDLLRYYHNRQRLKAAEESMSRLESLNADYDALLQRLEEDPNLIERIAPATLGTEPADANAVYPRATAEYLTAARKVLTEGSSPKPTEPMIPDWIIRCGRPSRRIVLLLAGTFLIIISFVCFSPR